MILHVIFFLFEQILKLAHFPKGTFIYFYLNINNFYPIISKYLNFIELYKYGDAIILLNRELIINLNRSDTLFFKGII